jgi:3-methylcrotonyl-CoA carboxylase alpha subunit
MPSTALKMLRNTHYDANALTNTHVAGTITNVSFLISLCNHKDFGNGIVDTGLIERDMETLIAKEEIPEVVFALAALEALKLDLKEPLSGWRLWGEASHKITLVIDDEKTTKTIILNDNQSLSIFEEKETLRLEEIERSNNQITATLIQQTENTSIESKKISADVVSYQGADFTNSISVLYEGVTWVLHHPDPLSQAGSEEGAADTLKSPMTGVISQIKVAAGDAVKEGDRLGVIEAMKMEHSLIAPRDCVIAEWLCTEGSSVESGAVLVRFEESEQG